MHRWLGLVCGALAGLNGAACMSGLRMAAHRVGLIDRMPPQVLEEWLMSRTRVGRRLDDATHHVADHVLHLGIGMTGGLLYAAVLSRRGHPLLTGPLLGLAIWAVAFAGLLPRLGATRHPRESRSAENGVNLAAHILYGAVTGLMTEELVRQRRGVRSDVVRRAQRTG
jgi:hypothetical protein